jgi:hypothetical protein
MNSALFLGFAVNLWTCLEIGVNRQESWSGEHAGNDIVEHIILL